MSELNDCIDYIEGKKVLCYLVKIIYEKPEAVVYKNMSVNEYSQFSRTYPDKALSKGLKVVKIEIIKQFEGIIK